MPNYRRSCVPGGTYFFTVVTYNRRPQFMAEEARSILREAISRVRNDHPFRVDGFCLLPDHIHAIWTLPEDDSNYSQRWAGIKSHFSRRFRQAVGEYAKPAGSRFGRGEVTVWQRRFWEHLIRDENDFKCHLDYIHYNPVKHGYVEGVADWQWSSFRRYVNLGDYPMDWGSCLPVTLNLDSTGE